MTTWVGKVTQSLMENYRRSHRSSKSAISDFCPVAGIIDKHTHFLQNNTIVSLFRFDGVNFLLGDKERAEIMGSLRDVLKTLLREKNVSVQFVFQRDKRETRRVLANFFEPMRKKGRSIKLRVDELLDDRIESMLPLMTGNEGHMVLMTSPTIDVSGEKYKDFLKNFREEMGDDFPMEQHDGFRVYMAQEAFVQRHQANMHMIIDRLRYLKMKVSLLTNKQAFRLQRTYLFPESTPSDWDCRLPDDEGIESVIVPRMGSMDPYNEKEDIAAMMLSPIAQQIGAGGSSSRDKKMDNVIRVGARFISTSYLSLLPNKTNSLDQLVKDINDNDIPLRYSITFHGGFDYFRGKVATKKTMALATRILPPNKGAEIEEGCETLLHVADKMDDPLCGVSVMISTWGDDHKSAVIRARKVNAVVSGWGDTMVVPEHGDPLLAFTATVPGWAHNLRQVIPTYLSKMIPTLPISLTASPWLQGTMPFIDQNGGLFPYQQISRFQQNWNMLGFSPPGGGKSVLIANLMLAAILDPEQQGLPKIAMVDVGYSSKGTIRLLQSLAEDEETRKKFMHSEFSLSDEFGINVMDLRNGCTRPTSVEKGFLLNFLTLVMTPIGKKAPVEFGPEIMSTLVEEAYSYYSENQPKLYDGEKAPDVAEWLATQTNFTYIPGETTWYDVARLALQAKRGDVAASAQRFAVPCLKDLIVVLSRSESIKKLFGGDKENIVRDVRRMLISFCEKYPSLAQPSTYNFQQTDICALDVKKMTRDSSEEGIQRGGIAYLISRYLLGKDFLVDSDLLKEMPPLAQDFYREEVERMETVRKYLIFDEFHTTKGLVALRRTVVDDKRNGRKFNLSVALFSQQFEDFDEDMIKQSTVRFVLRAGNSDVARSLAEKYSWNDSIVKALIHEVRGATPKGAIILMDAELKAEGAADSTTCTQVLRSVNSKLELVAFTTTREDDALREALLRRGVPYWSMLGLIGRLFPEGIQKKVTEVMRNNKRNLDNDDEMKSSLSPIIEEAMSAWHAQNKAA